MKSLLITALLASSCQATLLSHLELQCDTASVPATTPIGFGVFVNGPGLGQVQQLPSQENVTYYLAPNQFDLMYAMAHDPAAYSAHGPVVVGMNIGDWVQDVSWHKFWQDFVNVIAQPNYSSAGATIQGTPSVLTTPWQGVSMQRTAWQWTGASYRTVLSVNIYDQFVPEPSSAMLLAMAVFLVSLRRP
jgi:hypothetical protein